jgi:hemolysin III
VTDGMKKRAEAGRERAAAAKEAMGERIDAAGERLEQARDATVQRMETAREATAQRVEAAKEATGERVEAAKQAAADLQEKVKPKLRGWIHQGAFPVSVLAGAILVIAASDGRERLALAIYAVSLSALLGTSALYHRVNWKRPRARLWMRRLDHSMIFLLIAGTLTPFALLVLDGPLANAILIAAWGGAAAGIVVELVWVDSPKWVSVAVYLGVGWIGAVAFPAIVAQAGLGAGILIAFGGLLYTIGAVIYAMQRPDPNPRVFGYHEIFHVLVVAAAAAHFVAIALYASPSG